jgi:hypothetical protein
MRLKSIVLGINVLAASCVIAITVKYVVAPKWAMETYAETYKEYLFQCDNVMRSHLITKHQVMANVTEQSVRALEAAELGLVSCHEYDKLRKRLLILGVTEHELAYLGLQKIEENEDAVREFVDTHEFRY